MVQYFHIKPLLQDVKTIIDVEANHSAQLGKLLNENLDRKVDYYIVKYTGRAMTCSELYESIKHKIGQKRLIQSLSGRII
jgi:2-oxoglutarate ferredoxin oxidoreductase subunit alpha